MARNIVIVGGGYAGLEMYLNLSKVVYKDPSVKLILISQLNYFYHHIASVRSLVEEEIISNICIPFDRIFTKDNQRFIHGKVTTIAQDHLKYVPISDNKEETAELLEFEYLVLALGSKYGHPFHACVYDRQKEVDHLKLTFDKVKESGRVLVVGSGATAVEVAGELATDYPEKKIILVSSGRLLPYLSEKSSRTALSSLQSLNVEVLINDKVDIEGVENFKSTKLTTQNGTEIEFDAFFFCVSGKPNTEVVPANWLNEKGFIKVNKNLQISMVDSRSLFAIGDCCDINEEKMALRASKHAAVVAYNIEKLVNGKCGDMKKYEVGGNKIMIVPVGRNEAIFQAGPFSISGFIPVQIKGKDLFIKKFRKMLNY